MAVEAGSLNRAVLLLALSCFCVRWPCVCHAQTDTIRPREVLVFSEKLLVSANGRFQLGFFNLGTNPTNGYLGIWYTSEQSGVKFWVANRETPLSADTNANLTLDADGLLKIMHGGGNPIPLNPGQTSSNSMAKLDNSGNLVVTELNTDGSVKEVLWESFDNPTDSLLPGMKLGVNLRTGKRWILTSWLSDEVPAPGAFTLEYNHSEDGSRGPLVMRRRGELYWTSGDISSPVKNIEKPYNLHNYNESYVFNKNEIYFNYSISGGLDSRWVLYPDGHLADNSAISLHMVVENQCQGYSLELGCLPQKLPKCRSRREKFERRNGYFTGTISGLKSFFDDNMSISLSDCWDRCWKNCSCVSFASFQSDKTGCQFWSEGAVFEQRYDGTGSTYYVSNLRFPTGKSNNEKWWIWVIVASAAAFLIILLSGYLCYLRRKKLQQDMEESILKELTHSDGFNNKEEIIGFDGNHGQDLKLFSFASILSATHNFSTENKLGQGGFGPVFKGKLPEGQEIAVKRLSRSSGQGLVEFKNELILIAKLQHMNLVRLLGCYVRGDEKMLIYEYMPNKSLDFFLFDPKRRELLDWKRRYNIIEGVAQGLLYLHRYSRLRIIHRDLKASNILLDNNMNPKISDFGMARIFGRNDAEANTIRVVGTYGYMSPEYAMEGNFSEKSDVYSFGVLMLEIVSGRRNTGYYDPEHPINLVGYAWELWKDGHIMELIDPTLSNESSRLQIGRCIHVGLLCVQDSAMDRPTMADVLPMIANQTVVLPVPKQVTTPFQHGRKEASSFEIKQESSSVSATITDLEPR